MLVRAFLVFLLFMQSSCRGRFILIVLRLSVFYVCS